MSGDTSDSKPDPREVVVKREDDLSPTHHEDVREIRKDGNEVVLEFSDGSSCLLFRPFEYMRIGEAVTFPDGLRDGFGGGDE